MVGHSQKGETPVTVRVVLRDKLIPAVLGLSVIFDQEALAQAMNRAVPGNLRAKGAVIMAAYDLAGKPSRPRSTTCSGASSATASRSAGRCRSSTATG